MILKSVVLFSLFLSARSQGDGGLYVPEVHPKILYQRCSATGICTTQDGYLVLDAEWRWLHEKGNYTNCYDGYAGWDARFCANPLTCAQSCDYEGAEYNSTYGIIVSGDQVSLRYRTYLDFAQNIGSRVFLLDSAEEKYQMFDLRNQEFAFDVDASALPCGYNGALGFVGMDADGGMAKDPHNTAGAKYGTGYCDAKCPRNLRFVNGQANIEDWEVAPAPWAEGMGKGKYGACCAEVGIWEANSLASVLTAHTCRGEGAGQIRCSDSTCDDGEAGICDSDGCDFNPYRLGDQTFLGPGERVNTRNKLTVITQFVTDTNSTGGSLSEIRRIYVQNGTIIQNSVTKVPGMESFDSISNAFCDAQKQAFQDDNAFEERGGLAALGKALEKGMVLAMGIGRDVDTDTAWLDSIYPPNEDPSVPGVARGPCSPGSGDNIPDDPAQRNPTVVFSNIKVGLIGSTYGH
ncbi:hypothetical protein V5O48_009804 [Marasmius crinis-equi]|uniref:Glucanase n=1 Tax=Marasmius crinis-equi TaxID=585013 RepID=A0ABR3FA67_9AGAR